MAAVKYGVFFFTLLSKLLSMPTHAQVDGPNGQTNTWTSQQPETQTMPFASFQVPQSNGFLTNNQPSTKYKEYFELIDPQVTDYQTQQSNTMQQHTTQTANVAQLNSIHQDQFGAKSDNPNFNSESNQYLPITKQSLNAYSDYIPNQENQFMASATNVNQQLYQSSLQPSHSIESYVPSQIEPVLQNSYIDLDQNTHSNINRENNLEKVSTLMDPELIQSQFKLPQQVPSSQTGSEFASASQNSSPLKKTQNQSTNMKYSNIGQQENSSQKGNSMVSTILNPQTLQTQVEQNSHLQSSQPNLQSQTEDLLPQFLQTTSSKIDFDNQSLPTKPTNFNQYENSHNIENNKPGRISPSIYQELPQSDKIQHSQSQSLSNPLSENLQQIPHQHSSILLQSYSSSQDDNDKLSNLNEHLIPNQQQLKPLSPPLQSISNSLSQSQIHSSQPSLSLNPINNSILIPNENVLQDQDNTNNSQSYDIQFENITPTLPSNDWLNKGVENNPHSDLINFNSSNVNGQKASQFSNDYSSPMLSENSNLSQKIENKITQTLIKPNKKLEMSKKFHEPLSSLENKEFYQPNILNGLAIYDQSDNGNAEDSRDTKKDDVNPYNYANSNDIHIQSMSPTDHSGFNNVNLVNPSPQTTWSYIQRPNNIEAQQSNANPNQSLLNPLFNSYHNQIPTYTLNNNNQFDALSSVDKNRMNINKLSDINDNQSNPNNIKRYMYKRVDLMNSPLSTSSWSLPKHDYSKKLQLKQNNGYQSNNNNILRTSSLFNPNHKIVNSLPSSNDMFVQNMKAAIPNYVQIPKNETMAVFDVTHLYFPNSQLSEQVNLTYAVIQSTIAGLQMMLNTIVNSLFDQPVKREFDTFNSIQSIFPYNIERTQNIQKPSSSFLTKKDYGQPINPSNPYYVQLMPASSTMYMNAYNQPTTYFSTIQPITNTMRQQQSYSNKRTTMNEYGPENDYIVAQQMRSTPEYVPDFLANVIRNAINSNLPIPYTSHSPRVNEYTQKVISVIGREFKYQIDNVVQGNSPNINMSYGSITG